MSSNSNKGLAENIQVNGLTWAKTLMICAILVCAGVAAYFGANVTMNVSLGERVASIERTLEVPVNSSYYPFENPASYVVGVLDAYATLGNGTTGKLDRYDVNHTFVFQTAFDMLTVNGGSVYAKEGQYAASPIVRNNTRFIVEKGAVGISYTIDTSATCIIDDFNVGIFQYYKSGLVYSTFNYATGTLLTQSANLTTIYVQNINGINGQNVQVFKLIIENGSSFPTSPTAGYLFYYSGNNTLYYYNSTVWVSCGSGGTGGTYDYNLLINKPDLSAYLFQNGTRALTADWNVGSFGIYGLTKINTTSLYCTSIDQLITGQGVSIINLRIESGTNFPTSPIDKQMYFRSDLGYLYVYNASWIPIGYTPSTYPYANLTGVPQTFPYANLTDVPQTFPYGNLTGTPDLTVYLFGNGSRVLTGNWNIGGSYGIYNATWVNATSASFTNLFVNGLNRTALVPDKPSYTIDTTGTTYRLWNGTTQQLDEESTNHSQIMWDAVGNCSAGGSVLWQSGRFPLTCNHTLSQNNITLYGQGASSILYLNANYTNPIHVTGNDLTVLNLAFDGNYKVASAQNVPSTGDLFEFVSGSRGLIVNCRFYGWLAHPIVSGVGDTADRITVYGCYFRNCTWWDVAFAGGNFNSLVDCTLEQSWGFELSSSYNTAVGNHVEYVAQIANPSAKGFIVNGVGNLVDGNYLFGGYMISVEGNNNTITNNVIENFSKGYSAAIVLVSDDNLCEGNRINNFRGSGATCNGISVYYGDRNYIHGNKISNGQGVGCGALFVYDATSFNNTFKDNYCTECTTYVGNAGIGTIFDGNYFGGLPCMKSGSTASCVNGTWIAHGVAGLPNGACSLKVNGSRLINATCYVMDPVIIAENSTHVQIEFLCNNAGTFNPVGTAEAKTILWSFEYKP